MVTKDYYGRLKTWQDLRKQLEKSKDPINQTVEFFDKLPTSSMAVDPYNNKSWPDPWMLIEENVYCRFLKVLGICYTLQLTDRFSTRDFEIHISIDSENHDLVYQIKIDNDMLTSYNDTYELTNQKSFTDSQSIVKMPRLN
jgi:hypothetical protein